MITTSGFLQIASRADIFTKFLLVALGITAILLIARFIAHVLVMRRHVKHLRDAVTALATATSEHEVQAYVTHLPEGSPVRRIIATIVNVYEHAYRSGDSSARENADFIARQYVEDTVAHYERMIPFYTAAAAVAPLLGLFGTIWGLVHAFIEIQASQSTDLAAIAPGIAEALLTTLAGLIVAIPAVLAYHTTSALSGSIELLMWQLITRIRMIYTR